MSRFCRIMAAKKKEEKFVFLTDNVTQGSKTKYEKKNLKSGLWPGYWYFSWLRTKINNWKIRHWPISAVNMKIFLWLVRKKVNNWEFCEKKATPIVCFCNGWTLFFILSFIADALYDFFLQIVKPIISFFKKSTFLTSKGLLCFRDKQNNRWSLADMELLFSCLSRYEEIITVYILLLDTLLVHCSRSRDNKLNIRRDILNQSTPKYIFSIYWMSTK